MYLLGSAGMFFYWGACASNAMHRLKLHRVLNAPLGFFLAKPVGELLSTFSSDQDKADESLPDVLHLAGTRPPAPPCTLSDDGTSMCLSISTWRLVLNT